MFLERAPIGVIVVNQPAQQLLFKVSRFIHRNSTAKKPWCHPYVPCTGGCTCINLKIAGGHAVSSHTTLRTTQSQHLLLLQVQYTTINVQKEMMIRMSLCSKKS